MQIGFNIWQELLKDKTNEELKKQFFLFFFISSCFIVLKVNIIYNFIQFDNPGKIKQFKNWVCNHNINLSCIFLTEKVLLKYCNWEININSPSDFIDTIYNNLLIKYKNSNDVIEKINKYKDISNTLLEFAICEYNIFSQYNQIIICLSSCLISVKQIDEEENNELDKNTHIDIQTELKVIIDNIINNINLDKNLIDSCSTLILKNLEKDEQENIENIENEIKEKQDFLDINNQLEITRTESNDSFFEAMNNYIFDKSFDNNQSKENENIFINFGKISPICHEGNIQLNEDMDDIFILNKKKNKCDISDNKDLLLLKRKRNKINN